MEKLVADLLQDVEKDENGSPIVIFRHGYQKVKLNGKYYIMPLTKEELELELTRPATSDVNIRDLGEEQNNLLYGYCQGVGYSSCQAVGTCRQCQGQAIGLGGWYCTCTLGG